MKTLNLFFCLFAAQSINAQISLNINHRKFIELTNNDSTYSYRVQVKYKNSEIFNEIIPPKHAVAVNYIIKKKSIAKKMEVVWQYDQITHDFDKKRQFDQIAELQYNATHIEQECWQKMRKNGWILVGIGALLGEGRILDALKEILLTANMDADVIQQKVHEIDDRLKNQYLGEKARLWLESVRAYYLSLSNALKYPFNTCDKLEITYLEYINKAKTLRDNIEIYDRKLNNELERKNTRTIWNYASNRHRVFPLMTGFGLEFSLSSQLPVDLSENVNNGSIFYGGYSYDVKANIPLLGGIKNRKRLFASITYGKAFLSIGSNNSTVFLGLKNTINNELIYAIDNQNSFKIEFIYPGVGLKYLVMPYGGNWWFSLEGGIRTVIETSNDITNTQVYTMSNNELTGSNFANSKTMIFNKYQWNPHFNIQFSLPLFSIASKANYPYRKKVVFGGGLGYMGLNTNGKENSQKIVQLNTKNSSVTNSFDLKLPYFIGLNAGLYLYF